MLKLLFFLIFASVQFSDASFKEQRDTVGKSSYTETTDINVRISSAPSFVRKITFAGVEPTTITIYNTQLFTVDTTTRSKVYWPGGQQVPTTVEVDVINSSGTMYHKIGNAQATFNWDWYGGLPYINALNQGN